MFLNRKKKKKTSDKAPVWFMWLMGGFIAYALLTNIFTDKVSEVAQQQASKPVELPEAEYLNFAVVSSGGVGNTGTPRPLFLRDVKSGSGAVADCWHQVAVHYRLYNTEGELLEDTRAQGEPVEFSIGRREVVLALERAVLGMREGGKRAATAHPSLLYGDPDFTHPTLGKNSYAGYVVTLEKTTRPVNLPFSDLGLRIYDDVVGEGRVAQCTDRVRIKLRGWLANGQGLWRGMDIPAIRVRIGEGEAPYAIERALLNMRVGGTRTLIVPPGYMNPLHRVVDEVVSEADEPEADASEQEQNSVETDEKEAPKTLSRWVIERYKELRDDNAIWKILPVPHDSVLVLEIEMLPEQLVLPDAVTH